MSHSECRSWVNLVDFDPLAALKLTTRSNLVGCSIDRSAGFARHPTLQSPWLASISARTRSTSWAPMSAVRLCAPEMVPWTGGNAPSQYRSGASSRRRRTFPSRRGTADAHLCAMRRRFRHRKGSASASRWWRRPCCRFAPRLPASRQPQAAPKPPAAGVA
jgi:hypothetical protein